MRFEGNLTNHFNEKGRLGMLYQIYGMVISSDELFPGMIPSMEAKPDVQIRFSSNSEHFSLPYDWYIQWYIPEKEPWLSLAKIDNGYILRFNELADFIINKNGNEIICIPKPRIPENTIKHLLLDQVIPLVINLRGGEAFHASAVLGPHGVIAFAGPAGSGKSTIAGSLLKEGYPLVSDDCLTLLEKNQDIYTIPAYPGLRLWDDTKAYLFGEYRDKSVAHYTRKLRLDIEEKPESYSIEPKPLRRLYDIVNSPETDERFDIVIEKLSPRDSFMALVRCAFRLDITDHHMLRRQFHFLGRIASRISVCRLTFPRYFDFLPAAREAIVNDLKDLDN